MLYRDYSRKPGEWIPNIHGGRENLETIAFLKRMNEVIGKERPDAITLAEESTSFPAVSRPTYAGGLGFHFKWNMGWMHDTLDYISRDPIYRSFHHHEMTFSMLYAYSENYVLPISHDEVVHGKGTLWGRMPGNDHVKAAGLRSLLAYQWAHPGKKLLFMGQEFGQRAEWSEERGVDWYQLDENSFSSGISRFMADVNAVYRRHPALWSQDSRPEGYSWIDANDSASNVLSFLRYGSDGSVLACVFNFAGSEHTRYRLGLPRAGTWREVLNSDATVYNGSGIGNFGFVEAAERPWHGRPASAELVLPPTSAVWLEPC
jgi:1,4-alpha-glucan branching enzyme